MIIFYITQVIIDETDIDSRGLPKDIIANLFTISFMLGIFRDLRNEAFYSCENLHSRHVDSF